MVSLSFHFAAAASAVALYQWAIYFHCYVAGTRTSPTVQQSITVEGLGGAILSESLPGQPKGVFPLREGEEQGEGAREWK